MMRTRQTSIGLVSLVLIAVGPGEPPAQPAVDDAKGYRPVGSGAALHHALQTNLKIVRDWVDEKDFASAAQTAGSLGLLTHLYSNHFADDDWRKRCTLLQEAVNRLGDAARRKAAADCGKAIEECSRLIDALGKNEPKIAGNVELKNYRPPGSLKGWMTLMDGTYADAKSAKAARPMALLAEAIAAEVNALAHLRADPQWRKAALDVRNTALQVAEQAREDYEAAKKAIKGIYVRCEACHERFQQ